ncbi:hypothetical protein VOLCADRAFT_106762 [Volvox carteri f. nagariensis]|uniref:Uncharacterized protein n=1 Tax=Volvox carteri f. nagariensis TaxID=3068 RepID=D8U9K5_VOLCA|nr:uncharacterized protein VOLCADRAFT_106762 [Volvox carteri f. nagariensis]EFJ43659.1 hypothetical protein VOLCADRAFT_106762 [Volvox carteri f. nagariensis]|eukprot:XP_002955359.1 hypothetical protein VOLCADRAFT_106762 [Volvox carteri f. nagariensis]
MKLGLLIALLAAVVGVASAQQANQNSWSYMANRNTQCPTSYSRIIESRYFANNETCKSAVKAALSTYDKSQCPDTSKYSLVWTCMSGWNGNTTDPARINDWSTFLSGCELLYIAQRANTAESEDGFVWIDNSCFGRYVNMAKFVEYLQALFVAYWQS